MTAAAPGGNQERPRIALLAGTLGRGGSEKQLVRLAAALGRAGAEVRVWSLEAGAHYEAELGALGVPVKSFRPGPIPWRLSKLIWSMRGFRPHVIQSMHSYANLYAHLAARALGGAVSVGALRGDWEDMQRGNGRWARPLMAWPDAVAVNSQRVLDQLLALGVVEPGQGHYLANEIDVPEPRDSWSAAPAQAVPVLFAGRLIPGKRLDHFLEALSLARAEEPALVGLIAGDGPVRAAMERRAAELGNLPSPGALTWLGQVDRMAPVYARAEILLFCSEHEGTPNTVIEAMAASLPVVTTPAGDAGLIVEHGVSGLVVETGAAGQMKDALLILARTPALRRQLGLAGRARVIAQFGPGRLARAAQAIYQAAARRASQPRVAAVLNNMEPMVPGQECNGDPLSPSEKYPAAIERSARPGENRAWRGGK